MPLLIEYYIANMREQVDCSIEHVPTGRKFPIRSQFKEGSAKHICHAYIDYEDTSNKKMTDKKTEPLIIKTVENTVTLKCGINSTYQLDLCYMYKIDTSIVTQVDHSGHCEFVMELGSTHVTIMPGIRQMWMLGKSLK